MTNSEDQVRAIVRKVVLRTLGPNGIEGDQAGSQAGQASRQARPTVTEADDRVLLSPLSASGEDLGDPGPNRGQRYLVTPPLTQQLKILRRQSVREPAQGREKILHRAVVVALRFALVGHEKSVPKKLRIESHDAPRASVTQNSQLSTHNSPRAGARNWLAKVQCQGICTAILH